MMPFWTNGIATLYQGDARRLPLDDCSVQMVVTSPPYWGLRDYGLADWQGGDPECDHRARGDPECDHRARGGFRIGPAVDHQQEPQSDGVCRRCGAICEPVGIGLEPSPGEHIENLVDALRETRRVLRPDGTVWLNYGDIYSTGERRSGLPRKNLMGLPWRVAFALQADGWILRSAIAWAKPNPVPESVRDRPVSAYDMIFLLAKEPTYYYDGEALRDGGPASPEQSGQQPFDHMGGPSPWKQKLAPGHWASFENYHGADPRSPVRENTTPMGYRKEGRAAARNVWTIPLQARPQAHFATFPDELVRRCILAGTPERGCCAECAAPLERIQTVTDEYRGWAERQSNRHMPPKTETHGWQPSCGHEAGVAPAVVLDPFVGSGTTCCVAQLLGRKGVGVDLSAEYLRMARSRLEQTNLPLPVDNAVRPA